MVRTLGSLHLLRLHPFYDFKHAKYRTFYNTSPCSLKHRCMDKGSQMATENDWPFHLIQISSF